MLEAKKNSELQKLIELDEAEADDDLKPELLGSNPEKPEEEEKDTSPKISAKEA